MNEEQIFLSILATLATSLVFLTFFNLPLAFSETTTDTATVNVSVAPKVEISILPDVFNFTDLNPGTVGPFLNFEIKNIGSVNVSNIFAYVDTLDKEIERPYGTSNASKYAAGGVLLITNETDTQPWFLGRIEWNLTYDVPNKNFSAVNNPVAWGYFRNTSYEYLWVIGNGTTNCTDGYFAIEDDPDTGSVDTRTPDDTQITNEGTDGYWGLFSVNRDTAPLKDYCVAVYWDCTKIYIYKYDKRNNFTSCSNSEYLYFHSLSPGEILSAKLTAYIPLGIPYGNLTQAILTIEATGSY